jgi:asparagine synthase (glutamine-hydrolysing)
VCGIVGMAGVDATHAVPMRETMISRGPDDAGIWRSEDGDVVLAQRRLAIIDLSPGGHQPMLGGGGAIAVTFNGEIYNFQELRRELEGRGRAFKSRSDTEVLLAAYAEWDTECVGRLNGMFAFGVYDQRKRRVLLARDRAGEKPLYYRVANGGLVFASELKALMADPRQPRELDPEALEHYLAYGYVPGERCILRGVHKLPPAHAMTFEVTTGASQIWRYWELPAPAPTDDAGALLEELDALLLDAVRLRLVADVPVAVLLSGGIDSSLVAAMAARASSTPVKTFTVSFPGHRGIDEAPFARMVAHHLGTEHTEVAAESATVGLLPELARQFDEPMADSSMVPTHLVSRLVRRHATVALGGDGGDELFGGYQHYGLLGWQESLRWLFPSVVRKALALAARQLPVGTRGRNHLIGFASDLATNIAHVNMYFDAQTRARLLAPLGVAIDHRPERYKVALCDARYSWLQQATRADFVSTMAEAYLVKVDRASMLCSLEVRAPWLDHRVIEFAFRKVPDTLRATALARKILPRRLAERILPRELDLRRKQGFSMPLGAWFKGEWGRYMEEVLLDPEQRLFDHAEVRRLLDGQRRGRANMDRLFALTIFELWRREYRVAV